MKRDFTIAIIKTLKWITLLFLFFLTIGTALLGTVFFDLYLMIILIPGMPYLLIAYVGTSLWLAILFLIKYIKKKRNIGKTLLLSCSIILLIFAILKVLVFTGDSIIKVNSRASQITNPVISEFIKNSVSGDPYIINIEISEDAYYRHETKINYFDKWFQTEKFITYGDLISYSGNSISDYAKDIRFQNSIISVILLIILMVLYVYFCRYIIKEYNILTDTESNENMAKQNLIKICSLVGIIAIAIIIFVTVNVIKNSDDTIVVIQKNDEKNYTVNYIEIEY